MSKRELVSNSSEGLVGFDVVKLAVLKQVGSLIDTYKELLWTAYKKSGNELSISLPVKLKGSETIIGVESTILFIESRIKDTMESTVDINQPDIFNKEIL